MYRIKRLDFNVAYACNLACKGCISLSDFNRKGVESLKDIEDQCETWSKILDPSIISIFGGEPLLQQKRLLAWMDTFVERFGFIPNIDFESNSTLKPLDRWYDDFNAKFTLSPKMSNNGDPEKRRYKPDVIAHHNSRGECFKFVIDSEEDEKELFEKYIDIGIVNRENVWLMPCCGSRDEHTAKSAMVANLCKKHNLKFSPRLQLVIWDMALKV